MGLSSVASAQVIQDAQRQSNERLEALIAEQRHTNTLLSELVRLVTANSVEPSPA
jgi:hypothetical protein